MIEEKTTYLCTCDKCGTKTLDKSGFPTAWHRVTLFEEGALHDVDVSKDICHKCVCEILSEYFGG